MKNNKESISILGKELEEILKGSSLDAPTRNLVEKAIDFGYSVGSCEAKYDCDNSPYNALKCIKRYERIKDMLKDSS